MKKKPKQKVPLNIDELVEHRFYARIMLAVLLQYEEAKVLESNAGIKQPKLKLSSKRLPQTELIKAFREIMKAYLETAYEDDREEKVEEMYRIVETVDDVIKDLKKIMDSTLEADWEKGRERLAKSVYKRCRAHGFNVELDHIKAVLLRERWTSPNGQSGNYGPMNNACIKALQGHVQASCAIVGGVLPEEYSSSWVAKMRQYVLLDEQIRLDRVHALKNQFIPDFVEQEMILEYAEKCILSMGND